MKNKSIIILRVLMEELKNSRYFKNAAIEQKHGTNGSRADIVMRSGETNEVYSIMIIKRSS